MEFLPDKASLWKIVRERLNGEPTDDDLCLLAVEAIEPLIDLYWADAIDEFETAVLGDERLRKAVSCCDFDPRVPSEIRERLYSHVRPQDDIGHEATSGIELPSPRVDSRAQVDGEAAPDTPPQ